MKFTIKYKLDNWNDTINKCRYNKYMANKRKSDEMSVISKFISNLPKIDKYPVEIVFKWHIKSYKSDLDNKSEKNILDQLQKSGILENDSIKYINKITHIAIKDDDEYVEVEII